MPKVTTNQSSQSDADSADLFDDLRFRLFSLLFITGEGGDPLLLVEQRQVHEHPLNSFLYLSEAKVENIRLNYNDVSDGLVGICPGESRIALERVAKVRKCSCEKWCQTTAEFAENGRGAIVMVFVCVRCFGGGGRPSTATLHFCLCMGLRA